MAKDPLDIGTSINVIDGVERGSASVLTATSSFYIDGTYTPSFTYVKNLLDGDNTTYMAMQSGTYYYVKLTSPIFVNFLTLRSVSTFGGTAQAWYSSSDSTALPSTWSQLQSGILVPGDTPQYAYRFLPLVAGTIFAVGWIRFRIESTLQY